MGDRANPTIGACARGAGRSSMEGPVSAVCPGGRRTLLRRGGPQEAEPPRAPGCSRRLLAARPRPHRRRRGGGAPSYDHAELTAVAAADLTRSRPRRPVCPCSPPPGGRGHVRGLFEPALSPAPRWRGGMSAVGLDGRVAAARHGVGSASGGYDDGTRDEGWATRPEGAGLAEAGPAVFAGAKPRKRGRLGARAEAAVPPGALRCGPGLQQPPWRGPGRRQARGRLRSSPWSWSTTRRS